MFPICLASMMYTSSFSPKNFLAEVCFSFLGFSPPSASPPVCSFMSVASWPRTSLVLPSASSPSSASLSSPSLYFFCLFLLLVLRSLRKTVRHTFVPEKVLVSLSNVMIMIHDFASCTLVTVSATDGPIPGIDGGRDAPQNNLGVGRVADLFHIARILVFRRRRRF